MSFRNFGLCLIFLSLSSCALHTHEFQGQDSAEEISEQLRNIEAKLDLLTTRTNDLYVSSRNVLGPVFAQPDSDNRGVLEQLIQPLEEFDGPHRLGVWNIEKLSPRLKRGFPELRNEDSFPPRTESQLQEIARYLTTNVRADALVLIEVDGDIDGERSSQLEAIVAVMGDEWEYNLAASGGEQRIALVFNKDRIRIKHRVELTEGEYKVQGSDIAARDPMAWWLSLIDDGVEYNDLILIGSHLKSGQSNFHNHMAAMAKVFGDMASSKAREDIGLPSISKEPEIVVLGDMNNSTHKRRGFRYIFDYAEALNYLHLGGDLDHYPATRVNGSEIDHIFVSDHLIDYTVPNSFTVHGVEGEGNLLEYRRTYSDHFPVTFQIQSY